MFGIAGAAEIAEAEKLQGIISAMKIVGKNTYLPLAIECLVGMIGY